MNREIFVVYNASTNKIELGDFGIIIFPDASVDLVNYDRAYVSSELDSYLSSGDLKRLINGASVGYDESFDQTIENIQLDGSLLVSGNLHVVGQSWMEDILHIDKKIHMHQYSNIADVSDGDLWIEPSTYNLMYKHPILSADTDASSYDLTDRLLRSANDWLMIPEVSTLDIGDRILIEDAQSGYAKRWVTASAFSQAATQFLYPSYEDALPVQTTTSTTYINALTLISDPSAKASVYRIGWTLQVANSKNGKPTWYRVTLDGSIIEETAVPAVVANAYSNWSGFQYSYLEGDPSGHIVAVDYYADPGSVAYIRNVRLEFRKADTADTSVGI